MTLFWHKTGPSIRYADEVLRMDDLNPENSISWRMSRAEMIKLGYRCIWAALRGG